MPSTLQVVGILACMLMCEVEVEVKPLGGEFLLQAELLVPMNFSLEHRGASKHSVFNWLFDVACSERAAVFSLSKSSPPFPKSLPGSSEV